MANATYIKTIDAGQEPDRKAVSLVSVDGTEVQISWWPSLIDQWGKEGTKAYILSEALVSLGFYTDAYTQLQSFVDGDNWAQRWINEHPEPAPVQPVTDPFL